MMRSVTAFVCLLSCLLAWGGPVRLQVDAPSFPGRQATLYRYMDAFTQRLEPIATGFTDSTGRATLQAEVEGTCKALLRVGDASADLWLRSGNYHIQLPPLASRAGALSGAVRVDPTFIDLDALDVNALVGDLNSRLDAFLAEGLATDAEAGMQAVAEARKAAGGLRPDTAGAGRGLYLSPTWSPARVDTFAGKLRTFYAEVHDPWFKQDLEYGIAGLYLGPRTKDRELFVRYLKDRPVLYDVPEYIRFFSNFYKDFLLGTPFRSQPEALLRQVNEGRTDSLMAMLAVNDFLQDGRLKELVLITNLYANRGLALFNEVGIAKILRHVEQHSPFPEHRQIASNMLWDLTSMAVGSQVPHVDLLAAEGLPFAMDSMVRGDVCALVVAPGNTYSEQELAAITGLVKEHGRYVHFVYIALDARPEALAGVRRSHMPAMGTWVVPADQHAFLNAWRIRSAPMLLMLHEGTLTASPGPLPSKGLAAVLHKLKTEQDAKRRLSPDRGTRPPKH